jgi:hypothetical protein
LDVGTAYAQMDHRFCRRWAVLTDPEETLGASGAGVKVQYTRPNKNNSWFQVSDRPVKNMTDLSKI